jgi:hypothetical protein
MNVSGPVPNENVAAMIFVAAVTPVRARVTIKDPTTKGLNCPPVIEALPFAKVELEGRIN